MKLSKEVKTGLIAILVLAVSVWGFNFLKGKNILKPTDEYYVLFDRADGLIESGNVMYQGYKVGNITSLEFNQRKSGKFRVKFVLEERMKIPLNSIVIIKQVNPLASTSDLEIIFSNNTQYHNPGDTLASELSVGLMDIASGLVPKLQQAICTLDTILLSVNQVMTPESQEKLRKGIASLEGTLSSLNASLSENGSLNRSIGNLESVTGNLRDNNANISSTLGNLSSITASLDSAGLESTLLKLDSTLVSLESTLSKIDEGEGTMGKLVNDSSLYINLDSTAYHLNLLIKDLKEHPKRYVHFSVFDKKEK